MQALGLVLGIVGAIWVWRIAMESAQRRIDTANPVINAAAVGAGLIAFCALITLALSPAFMH